MRRNNWKKYIIILIAFIVGLVANLAARAILPRLLPAGMQAWTGLLATLLEIVISVGIILIIIFTNHIGARQATNPDAIRLNAIDCIVPSWEFKAVAHSKTPHNSNNCPILLTIAATISYSELNPDVITEVPVAFAAYTGTYILK